MAQIFVPTMNAAACSGVLDHLIFIEYKKGGHTHLKYSGVVMNVNRCSGAEKELKVFFKESWDAMAEWKSIFLSRCTFASIFARLCHLQCHVMHFNRVKLETPYQVTTQNRRGNREKVLPANAGEAEEFLKSSHSILQQCDHSLNFKRRESLYLYCLGVSGD